MRILDAGKPFGFATAQVFDPWEPTVAALNIHSDLAPQVVAADLILLGGGADICTKLYGHNNVASHSPNELTRRDETERDVVNLAKTYKKPVVGICRGAQLLCAMTGGWLVQHLDNHAGRDHVVTLPEDDRQRTIVTNSVHHQMMYPSLDHCEILGYTKEQSPRYIYDVKSVGVRPGERWIGCDPEIVHFGRAMLGFQFHPEYYPANHEVPKLVRRYTYRYCNVGNSE